MRRRTLLSRVGAGVLGTGVLSGCVALGSTPPVRLAGIRFANHDDVVHAVDLTVARDGNRVHDESYRVEPGVGTANGPSRELREPWMAEPGRYRFEVRLDERHHRFQRLFPRPDLEGSCYLVFVEVVDDWVDLPYDPDTDACESYDGPENGTDGEGAPN